MYSGREMQCTGHHIWALVPYYLSLEAAGQPPSLAPTPQPKILNTNRTSSLSWLDCERFWKNREVEYCPTSLYADSVQPVDGKSMNADQKVGKHLLPMAGVSLGGIQQDNEDRYRGRRRESYNTTQMSDTDSLTIANPCMQKTSRVQLSRSTTGRCSTESTTKR